MGIYLIQVEYYIHRIKQINAFQIKKAWGCFQHFLKGGINDCWGFREYLRNISMFPINADDEELIREFEKLNGVTINIFTLNQEAYTEDCKKKLHELWNARYITNTPARLIQTEYHIDLMLIKKLDGYKYDEKLG